MRRAASSKMRRWAVAVTMLAGFGALSPAVAGGAGPELDGAATASALAERGVRSSTRPMPPAPGCDRVVVIGDSLMDNARWWLVNGLRDAGFTGLVDAHHTRRIPAAVRAPYSGVRAAWQVRATWGEAECWVIALGSNDLIFGAGEAETARSMIEEMLAAITPGARAWWVNVDYHRDPRTSFDFVAATAAFNAELDALAAADPALAVIDWYSYAEANLHWFFDPVHVDRAGSIARAAQVVDALPR